MLSYRHGFHAGNHADVLKHVVLVAVLDYLTGKAKPLWVIDTHAGAGSYELGRGFSAQLGEYEEGVGRLWGEEEIAVGRPLPQEGVGRYLEVVAGVNAEGRLTRYPGSPWFARALTRREDRLWLFELHPRDFEALSQQFRDKRVRVAREDGLAALRSLLPPAPKRALVLIDPSYEVKADYESVVATLREALRRFPTGTYAVWYPLLELPAAQALPTALGRLGARNWLDVRLQVRAAGPGMYGSGMFVINPPYTLPDTLAPALEVLVRRLGQDAAADSHLAWHIE